MNRASCQNVTFLASTNAPIRNFGRNMSSFQEQSLVSVSDMAITQGIRGNPVPSGLKT
jgi:hypothetical protein